MTRIHHNTTQAVFQHREPVGPGALLQWNTVTPQSHNKIQLYPEAVLCHCCHSDSAEISEH